MSPPHRRQSRRARRPGWLGVSLLILMASVGGLTAGALGGDPIRQLLGLAEPSPAPGEPLRPKERLSILPTLGDSLNVLFMATDVDYAYQDGKRVMGVRGRTDTMMLIRLDPAANQARMLSIPRDTRVAIPGHGHAKINAANPYGGPELAVQVASQFLGLNVDRYLLVNTRGVIQLVDALGGVEVFVPKDLNYDDFSGKLHIHLKKGPNRLDGQKAHDFLRFRHDENGDIGRVQRQQAFLQALLKQYLNPLNLLKTPQLLASARENLVTDLSNDELLQIVGWGRGLKQEQVQLAMVPGADAMISGSWYWVAEEAGTRRVVSSFLTGEEALEAKAPQAYRVAIVDGVGDRPASARLRHTLMQAGYTAVQLDGAAPEQGQAETQIIAQHADVAGAQAVAGALGVGKIVVAATGNLKADFTIVMGKDWAESTVAPQAATP